MRKAPLSDVLQSRLHRFDSGRRLHAKCLQESGFRATDSGVQDAENRKLSQDSPRPRPGRGEPQSSPLVAALARRVSLGSLRDVPAGARRWVVEACHSWLNRNRGILIRWSKKDENHLAFLQLASGLIAFKRAHAAQTAATLQG
jgi:hypothetical protein